MELFTNILLVTLGGLIYITYYLYTESVRLKKKLTREVEINEERLEDIRVLRKSKAANQTWNTRYRNIINNHKNCIERFEVELGKFQEWLIDSQEKNSNQAEIIKKLNEFADESYIAINAVGNEPKKSKRLELLDLYMNK